MPQISVIVPVYNVEKYLHACLDSILAQTFTDFELILVDDGSPDSSGKICDEYAAKDSRIRVFHQENQGQAAARNFGVSQAKAEWIHFVDSDDIIHPQMLEILYNAVLKDNCKVSMCDFICVNSKENIVFVNEARYNRTVVEINDSYLSDLLRNEDLKYHSVCAKLLYKEILVHCPFTAGRTREDSAVVCKWLFDAGIVSYVRENMYYYIHNPTSTVHKKFDLKQLDRLWSLEQQINFCDKAGYIELKAILLAQYISLSFSFKENIEKYYLIYLKEIPSIYKKARKAVYRAMRMPQIDLKNKLYFLELLYPKAMKYFWVIINKIHIKLPE